MTQFLYSCFILFHLVPFLLTGYRPSFLNVSVILAIALSFHVGVWLGKVRQEGFARGEVWRFASPALAIPGLFALYLAARYETLSEILVSLSQGRIQELMLAAAVERYSGNEETSFLTEASTAIYFSLSVLVGTELGRSPSRVKIYLIVLMSLIVTFIQGSNLSRASIVLAILLGLTFYAFNRREELFRKGAGWAFKALALAFGAIGFIYAFAQYGRVYQEANAWGIVEERVENLLIGGHYAFLAWLDMPKFGGHQFGSGMFAFLNKLMGQQFVSGNFEQIEVPMGLTNIFLWYRGAIEDFGYFFVIFPLLCGYSIHSLASHRPGRLEILASMFGVLLILYPFYSPLYFTVFAIPFIAAVLLLPREEPEPVARTPIPAHA